MKDPQKAKRIPNRSWRFRAYFRLMDLATVLTLISLYQMVTEPAALRHGFEPSIWHEIVGWSGGLLATFLMLAGRWRDEFAEIVWRKSAATTVQLLFVSPFLSLFVLGVIHGWSDAAIEDEGGVAVARPHPLETATAGEMLVWIWALMITLFIFSFQFHRWRGSR